MNSVLMPPNDVLREALTEGTVRHPDGRAVNVVANISAPNSQALYKTVRDLKPKLVVEIGMAYGVSTLSILTALREVGGGRLISIDPYFGWNTGKLIALHQVSRAGLADLHEHWEEPSYAGLARMVQQKTTTDLVYIDGNHNFDYVFTDFFFADKLVPVGGVIGFNDSGWRSVFKVLKFMKSHRRYDEIDVGLPRTFTSRNKLFEFIKRLEGRSTNDRYFRKRDEYEPPHGFYRSF